MFVCIYLQTWQTTNVKQQSAASLTSAPVFRVVDVVEKIRALDREVKYLLNKAKFPRTKPKTDSKKKDAKKSSGKKTATVIEEVNGDANNQSSEPDLEQEYTMPLDEKMSQENQHLDDTATETPDSDSKHNSSVFSLFDIP